MMVGKKKHERVRVTVSIDPDVLDVFKQQADVLGVSVSRAIGDWCGDTVESAQLVLGNIKRAKSAPAEVMREMQEWSRSLVKSVDETAKQINDGRGSAARMRDGSRRP